MRRSRLVTVILAILLLFMGVALLYNSVYAGKIFPNIFVDGINVGGLTTDQAEKLLEEKIEKPEKIDLTGDGQDFGFKTEDIELQYNFKATAGRAFGLTRSGNILVDQFSRFGLIRDSSKIGLVLSLNEEKLAKALSVISGQLSIDPVYPSVKLANGKIEITKGSAGREVDQLSLRAEIGQKLSFAESGEIIVPIVPIDPSLTDEETVSLKNFGENFLKKSIHIKFEDRVYNLIDADIIKLLDPHGGLDQEEITKTLEDIASKINRDPQNPKFNFANGKVTEFQPALDGIKVSDEKFNEMFLDSLVKLQDLENKNVTIDVPTERTPPEVSTDKVNNLGIKELIGRGTSTFYHSIPSRVHNVVLAASRINGTLVKPGDTFSFNDTLGDVSHFTGYKQAYIISGGKTILGDGGGVCQVSTTLFRAILNSGLPITERTAHAYRVGYYEQNSPPGLDATVYGPTPDLKFTNDTPAYILIVAQADPKNYSLAFEIYGTSDGRVSTITKPIISNVVPALPTVYQDDPTLPIGTTKQIDFSAIGSRVSFNYSVKRSGEIIFEKNFVSVYRPWAAVYLKGTAPSI